MQCIGKLVSFYTFAVSANSFDNSTGNDYFCKHFISIQKLTLHAKCSLDCCHNGGNDGDKDASDGDKEAGEGDDDNDSDDGGSGCESDGEDDCIGGDDYYGDDGGDKDGGDEDGGSDEECDQIVMLMKEMMLHILMM